MKIKKFLSKKRLSLNLTQTEMAERIGTSQSYYSQVESGSRKPGIRFIKKIANYFSLSEKEIREML